MTTLQDNMILLLLLIIMMHTIFIINLIKKVNALRKRLRNLDGMDESDGLEIGSVLPDLSLPSLNGHILKTNFLQGKMTYLIVISPYCKSCIENLEKYSVLANNSKHSTDTQVYLLSKGDKDEISSFRGEGNIMPDIYILNEKSQDKIRCFFTPFMYIVDANGIILYSGIINQESGYWKALENRFVGSQSITNENDRHAI